MWRHRCVDLQLVGANVALLSIVAQVLPGHWIGSGLKKAACLSRLSAEPYDL